MEFCYYRLYYYFKIVHVRLKIDPAAVQSPWGSNALEAVQALSSASLNPGAEGARFSPKEKRATRGPIWIFVAAR